MSRLGSCQNEECRVRRHWGGSERLAILMARGVSDVARTSTTMNVLLQSPNTSRTITLPSPLIGAPLAAIQHHLECHPPTFPSDASCDIPCPSPESSTATFTRPPLTEWKELADKEATFEDRLKGLEEKIKLSHKVLLQRVAKNEKSCDERLKFLEGKIHEVDSVKSLQKVLMRGEVDRHMTPCSFCIPGAPLF